MAKVKDRIPAKPAAAEPVKVSSGLSFPSEITCPFTGAKLNIRMVSSDGLFMGIGPFWSTRLFKTQAELVAALKSRPGKTEAAPSVEIRDNVEPEEDPVADLKKLAEGS